MPDGVTTFPCDMVHLSPLYAEGHEELGFPLTDDNALFEHLMLHINMSGMNALVILKKRDNFRKAFKNWDVAKVAAFTDKDRDRLMADAGIIRNPKKIDAAIENAQRIRAIQKSHGSWVEWLEAHHPQSEEEWIKLFKKTFVFAGPATSSWFLRATGWLPGAHREDCPVYKRVLKAKPPWTRA